MQSNRVPQIFDKNRRAARYRRASLLSEKGNVATWLDQDMTDDMLDRIDFMQLSEGKSAIIGDVKGMLELPLKQRGIAARLADLGTLDEEQPWPIGPFDYIFAIRTLSTLNDLPGALLHARHALREDGIYFAQILGAGSFTALRQIMLAADGDTPAARVHPQIDNQAASALLARAGFSKQVVDSRTLTVRFSSFERMIGDLREQALTGILADRPPPLTKGALSRAREAFAGMSDDNGKVSETVEVLALTGWR